MHSSAMWPAPRSRLYSARRNGTGIDRRDLDAVYGSAPSNELPYFDWAGTGQPFDCTAWTTTDGPGTFVQADTALNAIPGVDAANVRKIDD